MSDLKTSMSILGDIMNINHAQAAANLGQANPNQAQPPNHVRACDSKCMLKGLIFALIIALVGGGIYYKVKSDLSNRQENRRILFEKFDVHPCLWKPLQDAW